MPLTDTKHPTGWTTRWGIRKWYPGYNDRPEQQSIEEWRKHKLCEFHTNPNQPVIREYPDVAGGMTLQGATMPSHQQHWIIRPTGKCWPANEIHRMGGSNNVLDIYYNIVLAQIHDLQPEQTRIVKYAGKSAGMSQPDDHTHLLLNPQSTNNSWFESGPETVNKLRASKSIISESGNVRCVCYPVYQAGQCWLVNMDDKIASMQDVVQVLTTTNNLFGERFRSVQGLHPDWSMGLRFFGKQFAYGVYTPRIVTPGQEQTEACLFPDVAVAMQCSPEEIIKILGVR